MYLQNEEKRYFELRSKIKCTSEVRKNVKIQKCKNVSIKILAIYFVLRSVVAIFAEEN